MSLLRTSEDRTVPQCEPGAFKSSLFAKIGVLLFFSVLLFTACERFQAESPRENPFGDPYEIVTNETPASPEILPHIRNDSLITSIAYQGGCETHGFSLVYEIRSDTTALWITHDAHGDDCEAYVRDRVEVPVPSEALNNTSVILHNPEGGPPFILRWRE